MKEKKNKKRINSRIVYAFAVIAVTVASLAVTMPLLGCDQPGGTGQIVKDPDDAGQIVKDPDDALLCEGCGAQVDVGDEHVSGGCNGPLMAGITHFQCDMFDHTKGDCDEHLLCLEQIEEYNETKNDKNEIKQTVRARHKNAPCQVPGHFVCDGNQHDTDTCSKAAHEHSFGKATCTSPAVCTAEDCDETSGEKDPSNHIGNTETKDAKDATCITKGYTGDTYCLSCNTVIENGKEIAENDNHIGDTEIRNAVAATCKAVGYTGDTYCLDCNTVIGTGEEIPKLSEHTGDTEIRNAILSTCSTKGYTGDTYCLDCGELTAQGTEIAENEAHSFIQITNIKASTCAEPGYTGDKYCLACGKMVASGEEIPKLSEHTGDTEVRNNVTATCGSAGYTGDTYCLDCNTVIETGEEIPKLSEHTGDTEYKYDTAATCGSAGYTGDIYCLDCGEMVGSGEEIPKLSEHTGDTELKGQQQPDCCQDGYTGDIYCLECNDIIGEGEIISATGQHPAALCCTDGHHAHDERDHSLASCQILGHYVCSDSQTVHDDWMCLNIKNDDNPEGTDGLVEVHVTVSDPGSEWGFSIAGIDVNNTNYTELDHETMLGGYAIKLYFTTVLSDIDTYAFEIKVDGNKKVYIADPNHESGYNAMIIDGENPAVVTVAENMLNKVVEGDYTAYILYITIM